MAKLIWCDGVVVGTHKRKAPMEELVFEQDEQEPPNKKAKHSTMPVTPEPDTRLNEVNSVGFPKSDTQLSLPEPANKMSHVGSGIIVASSNSLGVQSPIPELEKKYIVIHLDESDNEEDQLTSDKSTSSIRQTSEPADVNVDVVPDCASVEPIPDCVVPDKFNLSAFDLPDAKCLDGTDVIPDIIDYRKNQNDAASQIMCLTSADEKSYYCGASVLRRYFKQNNGGVIHLSYPGHIVNIMLNLINEIINPYNDKCRFTETTVMTLWHAAIHLNIPTLEDNCEVLFNRSVTKISQHVVQIFEARKKNKNYLYQGVIEGRIQVDPDMSREFFSECYNFGIKKFKDGVVINIVPYYVATDEELEKFTLGFRFANTIEIFLKIYRERPTLGAAKLMYRICLLQDAIISA